MAGIACITIMARRNMLIGNSNTRGILTSSTMIIDSSKDTISNPISSHTSIYATSNDNDIDHLEYITSDVKANTTNKDNTVNNATKQKVKNNSKKNNSNKWHLVNEDYFKAFLIQNIMQ